MYCKSKFFENRPVIAIFWVCTCFKLTQQYWDIFVDSKEYKAQQSTSILLLWFILLSIVDFAKYELVLSSDYKLEFKVSKVIDLT